MKKAPQNTPKYKISAKSVRGFGSYEHLKFRPTCQLKYRLWRHNDIIVMTSQISLLPLCRIHQAWHLCQISWSSEQLQQSYDGGPSRPPPPMTDSSKKAHRVKDVRVLQNCYLRRLRIDLLNPKFGNQKSALLWLKSHNFSETSQSKVY